jgi:hypothetical protein
MQIVNEIDRIEHQLHARQLFAVAVKAEVNNHYVEFL